ncbi:MAG TPA: helix-turn-helix domain-containing protein [Niabella sp.]|nr:helix-turn-helix domain-containing protein [Niabella sp.]HQW14913.1 helix-turn-helix domain-containing protein [Niabella sp.]HQX18462.1 helix-turn-helix domain-containing protein [Niabella sp.]HRB05989.1 helix-turn-helix domain-containing protein [Niabella sp.]HRB36875.1 helix-turn-helix domain-containing protein [Niabella sp.]
MSAVAAVQEWVLAFEKHLQERFDHRIHLLVLENNEMYRMDMAEISRIVASVSGVSMPNIYGSSRKREWVNARHTAMYLSCKYTLCSLKEIGYHFGQRDHSAVIHARDTVKDRLEVQDQMTLVLVTKTEAIIKKLIHEKANEPCGTDSQSAHRQ